MDWGVSGDGDEDIYQTPVGGAVGGAVGGTQRSSSPSGSSLKKSETMGNMSEGKLLAPSI